MEAKLWSEEHESHIRRINGDECAKQHEVIRDCGTVICKCGGYMERKRYDLIPGGLVRDNYPSNSESQEVSRGRSSEEISVMEMERRTE